MPEKSKKRVRSTHFLKQGKAFKRGKAACGTRTPFLHSPRWADVDCAKCLAWLYRARSLDWDENGPPGERRDRDGDDEEE